MNKKARFTAKERESIILKKGEIKRYNEKQMLEVDIYREAMPFTETDFRNTDNKILELTEEFNEKLCDYLAAYMNKYSTNVQQQLITNNQILDARIREFQSEIDRMDAKIDELKIKENRCSDRIENQINFKRNTCFKRVVLKALFENACEKKSRRHVITSG